MKTLFLCRANAGRSQVAEAFYNALTGTNNATSAGLDLLNSSKGADPTLPDAVLAAMNEAGYDLSSKRRKELTPAMVDAADRIISMVTDFPLPDYLVHSPKVVRWDDIPDAVRMPVEGQRKMRDAVKEHVVKLLASDE